MDRRVSQFVNHAACGVGMLVNLGQSSAQHQLIKSALDMLANFEYRSGINPATDECDGAGIRFFGLPTAFFKRQIDEGAFELLEKDVQLVDGGYAIGHYFLPTDAMHDQSILKKLQSLAKEHGLTLVAWRDLGARTRDELLSPNALIKKPFILQAIILPIRPQFQACLTAFFIALNRHLPEVHILSQSHESMVFKGMIKPSQFRDYFLDFLAEDFTAHGAIVHGRFATNTNPQWKNAQPCNHYIAHNGEFNSAQANLIEMQQELEYRQVHGLMPQPGMSDSLQFDDDLFNQRLIHERSIIDSLVRLMPPRQNQKYHPSINHMLEVFLQERTPYNGPAFVVGGADGYFFAKLDNCGLRPSRWNMIELDSGVLQICAASDDYFLESDDYRILKKSQLNPGGMLVITPNGELLNTDEILNLVIESYPKAHFDHLIQENTLSLSIPKVSFSSKMETQELNRRLFASGWDFETIKYLIAPMAENGYEPLAAMGDDTNPLHSEHLSIHLSYFFHQLFAQVSAPSIDSIREKDQFSLQTRLKFERYIVLPSPILRIDMLEALHASAEVQIQKVNTHFSLGDKSPEEALVDAIQVLMEEVEIGLTHGCHIFEITDAGLDTQHMVIPDLLAVAAVKKILNQQNKAFKSSIIVNSLQITGPHQAACLLALGAQAIFARGVYLKLDDLYDDIAQKYENYCQALEKSLLKTMGKLGITDVNNYINGQFIAALGLDLVNTSNAISLASLFGRLYSPLKGIQLSHVAHGLLKRHHFGFDVQHQFNPMPRSGYFMPEKNGIVHGYGPVVVNAFTAWMKAEQLKLTSLQLHRILERRFHQLYLDDLMLFQPMHGFLDPSQKQDGYYHPAYLEAFKVSHAFREMSDVLDTYKHQHPTCIRDYFKLNDGIAPQIDLTSPLQSQAEIRRHLFSGSMSQGALTVADPDKPHQLGAHETLTRGINAIGAMSASGEGGEEFYALRTPLFSTKSKQIASGRFGVSARQMVEAKEIEIKISQGAKPGEGGELPGSKVSIRFAAQRGGIPGMPFVSPPPHHDIYSIEDLEQLIHDLKMVAPHAEVAVKLVASQGIGTIAVGVAKAGADVINIASNSGGTGAALQSSIKSTGLPGELGLVEVDRFLRAAGLRDLVKLRTSGGIKTANDVIVAAILGADQFELGTTAMLTLGCKMQRTCNQSCQPGVATDGHLFKGTQTITELFFTNLAADIQQKLKEIGVANLAELRCQTDLLSLIDSPEVELYDFQYLLEHHFDTNVITDIEMTRVRRSKRLINLKEQKLIAEIDSFFQSSALKQFVSKQIELNAMDLSFGAGVAGRFVEFLEAEPTSSIVLNTTGIAGQSFGFVMPKGMSIYHHGLVQDGCGKSMTGGEFVIQTKSNHAQYLAHEQTIGGNALFYGASGGKIFVNGIVGHRFAILMKGAEVVVEGVGDLAFEYMTSGTGLILGASGRGIGTGSTGGVVIAYAKHQELSIHDSMCTLSIEESVPYARVIEKLLNQHIAKTGSVLAKAILKDFNIADFKILLPRELNKINKLEGINQILRTYQIREEPLTLGMQVWFEQLILKRLSESQYSSEQLAEFKDLIQKNRHLISSKAYAKIHLLIRQQAQTSPIEKEEIAEKSAEVQLKPKKPQMVQQRLGTLAGGLDELMLDVLSYLNVYIKTLTEDAEGCSGCKAQSCAGGEKVDTGCPSGKSINSINASLKKIGLIKSIQLEKGQWRLLREAFELQIQESPFIAYTGAACPAPCQDACTEGIPDHNTSLSLRGKLIGEPVHIKQIEFLLYQLGRALGWFDGIKHWCKAEVDYLFGSEEAKFQNYDVVMSQFKCAFQRPLHINNSANKRLIIVGSGPAGMQIAFMALKDGLQVEMYERSNQAGGLLADGIPAHKFDKVYLEEDFQYLINMGLILHLNAEVYFDDDAQVYKVNDNVICEKNDNHVMLVMATGAGEPRKLSKKLTEHLSFDAKNKIVQANLFLKSANDLALIFKENPDMGEVERESAIEKYMGHMDPRGKKVVVLGGGDTAQDVVRWVARYFNHTDKPSTLEVFVRGPEFFKRGLIDAYPSTSRAPTTENHLKAEELLFVQGKISHLVETEMIHEKNGKLALTINQAKYLHHEYIEQDLELSKVFDDLPRESRRLDRQNTHQEIIEDIDIVICALGFYGRKSSILAQKIEQTGQNNVFFVGDASDASKQIIVGAQANAKETYLGQIRKQFHLDVELRSRSMFNSRETTSELSSIRLGFI